MKTLIVVGGPMGVGKTAVCRALQHKLPRSALLDGDWCWDADPFVVTEETKAMVTDNITHLLANFLHCSAYENVLFCWVLQEQAILDGLLTRLPLADCRVRAVSLVCTPETLFTRLQGNVDAGLRQGDVIPRALSYLPLYAHLQSPRIDTTELTVEEAADRVLAAVT